ncbi:MAG: RNA polymerase-associated protein RapA [Gammaproteobacteria bacterium]
MNQFFPGQRWISNAEPELGLGIVLEAAANRVTLLFLACNQRRIYAKNNAPLTRVRFAPGDAVESSDNAKMTVSSLSEAGGLITYRCRNEFGDECILAEIDLNHHLQFNKPQDRLFTGQIDPASWFTLRYDTWRILQRLQRSPVRGLIGGRTSLMPHQLYIAHEAANRQNIRIMLADEVGLGKTIEAGLILHHRIVNGRAGRVLVLVPDALVHQWMVEMVRRFNLRFSVMDEERCLETPEGNPFASEQLIICSQKFFSDNPNRRLQALQSEWDMVIVDEAHHLEWKEHHPGADYLFVEKLARLSPGLILLTATPEQLGKESHFARLRLLDPDRFFSLEKYIEEEKKFEPVAEAARRLLENRTVDADLRRDLTALLKTDNAENLLQKIDDPDESAKARGELIDLLLDHHGTGRVLFRNSRRTVHGFPRRKRHGYPLRREPDTVASGLVENPDDDLRFHWLARKLLALRNQKALLICRKAETAIRLERDLHQRTGMHAAVFHEGMNIIERDRAAAYFADPESSARLLICSEIGSEGRNFQFAHHLILFDLPEDPDLLQQRIGRLDRIGQRHEIEIHVPYLEYTAEEILFRWYDQGLNAFLENSSAARQVFDLQKEKLADVMQSGEAGAVSGLIEETSHLRKQIEAQLQNGRDLLLEFNSCRMDAAQSIITGIQALEKSADLWNYMERIFDSYGVETETHSEDCYIVQPGNHMRVSHFPELPEDGVTVTVNRNTALAREDMQFLSWEHPMLEAAMDLILSGDTGNATLSIVKNKRLAAGRLLLESLFIVECSAPAEFQLGRFLPPTPLRILVGDNLQDLTSEIPHDSLIDVDHSVDFSQFGDFISRQRKLIETMLAASETTAQRILAETVKQSGKTMLDCLGSELKRLTRLKKINPNIRDEEIEGFRDVIRASYGCIQSARLKLDAVRIVIGS